MRIRVPNDTPWRAALNGAVLSLQEAFNWESFGNLDPLATVEVLRPLVAEALGVGDWCMLGAVWPYASQLPPEHTLACDGATYTRAAYPNLYAVLDPVFIIDADHFQVPNMAERFALGASLTMGGPYPVGGSGGEFEHTLDVTEIPSHTHTDTGHTHGYTSAAPNATTVGPGAPQPTAVPFPSVTASGNAVLDNTGGDGAHNNTPPYLALKWCIVFE